MTKKQIKKLALASYTNNKIDGKKVDRVIKHFTKSELKNYIKYLKTTEVSKNIIVEIPDMSIQQAILKDIRKIYPEKNINFKENKSLLAGIRIIDNDIIYDANIKDKLENLVSYINY